ncbi:MAG: hypothetical protein IJS17_05800 [Clostridia bacterium]|nr:hypothetical protein [Clostridia bacterium]
MKRISKSIISILLAAALLAGMSAFVFADEGKPVTQYSVYTCLGDSMAAGYATSEFVRTRIPAPNAYHSKIADVLGVEELNTFASNGIRNYEMRYLLDPDYELDNTVYADSVAGTDVTVHLDEIDTYKDACVDAVKRSDLITLQFGGNDFVTGFKTNYGAINRTKHFTKFRDFFESKGSEKAVEFIDKIENYVRLATVADKYFKFLWKTANDYIENFDAVVGRIYEYNPDVTLVVMSVVNCARNITYHQGDSFKIGTLLDPILTYVNNYLANRSPHKNSYTYVDIFDVQLSRDTCFETPTFWADFLRNSHPTDEQHTLIAGRILEALERDSALK